MSGTYSGDLKKTSKATEVSVTRVFEFAEQQRRCFFFAEAGDAFDGGTQPASVGRVLLRCGLGRRSEKFFTEMVDCVFRHGGTLDKFIGDAVMAQWGAPIGSTDDADQAMAAAMEMMTELKKLNVRWKDAGRPTLEIGIGLNFGEAFAGNIGSERRLEFTVIGDTVNTASRLCGAAAPAEILLSDDMRRALSCAPPLDECPPMALKNKTQPVKVYRVRHE